MLQNNPSKPSHSTQDDWEVLWSRHLDMGARAMDAVAGAVLDGRDVVVAAGLGGIGVWDAADGKCLIPWLAAVDPKETLWLATAGEDSIAITSSSTGSLHVWDLHTGLPQKKPLADLRWHVKSLSATMVDSQALAVVTTGRHAHHVYDWGSDSGVSLWDMRARRQIQTLKHSETTTAVALGSFCGRAYAAVAGYRMDPDAPYAQYPEDAQLDDTFGSMAVFDAVTGQPYGPVTELGCNWHASALAMAEVGGKLLAFAVSDDPSGGLQVVDILPGQVMPGPSWAGQVREIIVTIGLSGHPLVLARSRYSPGSPPVSWLWDPESGQTLFEAPPSWSGHLGLTRGGKVIQFLHGELRLLQAPPQTMVPSSHPGEAIL